MYCNETLKLLRQINHLVSAVLLVGFSFIAVFIKLHGRSWIYRIKSLNLSEAYTS